MPRITDTAHGVLWSARTCLDFGQRMSNLGGSARPAAPCAMNSTARRPRSPSSDADCAGGRPRSAAWGSLTDRLKRHPGPITCSPSPAYGDRSRRRTQSRWQATASHLDACSGFKVVINRIGAVDGWPRPGHLSQLNITGGPRTRQRTHRPHCFLGPG